MIDSNEMLSTALRSWQSRIIIMHACRDIAIRHMGALVGKCFTSWRGLVTKKTLAIRLGAAVILGGVERAFSTWAEVAKESATSRREMEAESRTGKKAERWHDRRVLRNLLREWGGKVSTLKRLFRGALTVAHAQQRSTLRRAVAR